MIYILPGLRKSILGINFYYNDFDKQTLFGNDQSLHPLVETMTPVKHFLLRMPTLFHGKENEAEGTRQNPVRQKENELMVKLVNYLWTVQLGRYSKIREYAYLVALVMIFVAFFLGMFHLYYEKILFSIQERKFLFILFFLIVWMFYVILRLKSINGTHYYQKHFKKFWAETSSEYATNFNSIVVYELQRHEGILVAMQEYTPEHLKNDRKKNTDTSLEKIIEIVTAIVTMMIMQYIT